MKNFCHKILFGTLAAALGCSLLLAQDAQQPAGAQAPTTDPAQSGLPVGPVIKKESKLVLVDAVVTDKHGDYVHDLTQADFKVYEDNKEQPLVSFFAGTAAPAPADNSRHYLVLFFDNSSMSMPDQMNARNAATKFIETNAGPNNLIAVVEFGGSLRIVQNFTSNPDLLQAAAKGVKTAYVASNATAPGSLTVPGLNSISTAEADYGARSMLLSVRTLAKNLRSVPGRKMLVLLSAGFPLTPDRESELTATIDACNKANVAVYSLDARGLSAPLSGGGSARAISPKNQSQISAAKNVSARNSEARARIHSEIRHARLVLAGYPEPQKPGGGGGGGGRPGGGSGGSPGSGGGRPSGGGGTGGSSGGSGGKPTSGGGTGGRPTGNPTGGRPTSGGGTTRPTGNPGYYNTSPYSQPRTIMPQLPPSTTTNQQILALLAEGTGGFTIFNTNDLLGGLQKISREQNEFYLLGYVPPESSEGSCHTLKVKMNKGGLKVRARSGYCNSRPANVLEGTPTEKQLELRAQDTQSGSVRATYQAPYFYTGPNVARVNLSMDIPSETFKFDKDKGKYHASLNVLGIAYNADGSVGARFSDQVKLDLEKDDWKDFLKNPYHYENQFNAAPGKYKMTVVLGTGSDTFGKMEWPLQIDNYDGKNFSLGGIVISNDSAKLDDIATSADLDATLLEDRTPLVVKGMQINPVAVNRFKKSDHVVMYSEIYEPLLTTENPPRVVFGYKVFDRNTNKEVSFTGTVPADEFIQKGSPVVPVGLLVKVKDLGPGAYRLLLMAKDGLGRDAPNRSIDFDVSD